MSIITKLPLPLRGRGIQGEGEMLARATDSDTMKKVAVLIMAGLLLGCSPKSDKAGTHLQPVDSAADNSFDDSQVVTTVFKEAYEPNVLVRSRITGSMILDDEMIFLVAKGNRYRIVHLRSPVSLVMYTEGAIRDFGHAPLRDIHGNALPSNVHDIKPERCAIDVPASPATQIVAAWRGVLLQTHYDEKPRQGLDGASATFSMASDNRRLEGRIWSPDNGTQPAMLWHLAESMSDYCDARTATSLRKVESQANELVTQLKSESEP